MSEAPEQPQNVEAPDTKIITLLEQNKVNITDGPGTFSVNLSEQVVLKEGDSLTVANTFVDTTSLGTNFINVGADETDITINTGIYMVDTEVNTIDPTTYPPWFEGTIPAYDRPDARKYILQNQSQAFLNTYLNWKMADNPWPGSGPIANFTVELKPLTPSDPGYGYGFQYQVISQTQPPPAPAFPPAPDYNLTEEYMIGGHVILVSNLEEFEFHYYPNGWTPAGGTVNPNDHSAVITRWVEGGVIQGWKIQKNFLRPPGLPENEQWLFSSSQFVGGENIGFNYFRAGDQKHLVQVNAIKMPINYRWRPVNQETPYQTPAVRIDWIDEHDRPQTASTDFSYYKPQYGPSPVPDQGPQDLVSAIFGGRSASIPDKEPAGGGDFVPDDLQGAKNGWGTDRTTDWYWFNWKQQLDPNDNGATVTFPPFIVPIDNPIYITFFYRYGAPPNTGKPVDTGFVNESSKYFEKGKGMRCIPWQLTTTAVVNPASNGCQMNPRSYDTKFSIPPGNYTYDALAQIMTDKINAIPRTVFGLSNNPDDPTHPVNFAGLSTSRMFPTTYELGQQYDGYAGIDLPTFPNNYVVSGKEETVDGVIIPAKTAGDTGVQPFWVSEDGTQLFRFEKTAVHTTPRIIGAQSFSIIFDDSSQTFQIEQAHSSIYENGPAGDPAPPVPPPGPQVIKQIKVLPTNPPTDSFIGELKIADKSSGVFINSMKPESLFFDKMRFKRSMLTTTATKDPIIRNFATGPFLGDARLASVRTHDVSLETGRNITGLFLGTDALAQKNASFAAIGYNWNLAIEASTPIGLEGQEIIPVSDDQPYFQIEISGINNQNIHLPDSLAKNNLIQAYVGKYYSNGNFTSSASPGFNYVHKGNDLVVKSLRVRILDSQGNEEPNLGPHSAVVLQLNTTK